MTRAIAAGRSYWWGRDPAQAWTYTAFVVEPKLYAVAHHFLADLWTVPCDPRTDPARVTLAALRSLV